MATHIDDINCKLGIHKTLKSSTMVQSRANLVNRLRFYGCFQNLGKFWPFSMQISKPFVKKDFKVFFFFNVKALYKC